MLLSLSNRFNSKDFSCFTVRRVFNALWPILRFTKVTLTLLYLKILQMNLAPINIFGNFDASFILLIQRSNEFPQRTYCSSFYLLLNTLFVRVKCCLNWSYLDLVRLSLLLAFLRAKHHRLWNVYRNLVLVKNLTFPFTYWQWPQTKILP